MNAIRLTPVVLSLAVLAAHFYRAGALLIALVPLVAATLLLVPRAWAARGVQAVLVLGAVEWAATTVGLVTQRQLHGQPWGRLAAILGAVTLATLLSALVFRATALRARYRPGVRPA